MGKVVEYLWHITLPVLAMVAGSFAVTAMLTKNAFLEEIRKQYVLTARAKGLSERQVLYRHVFRNALLPIVTGFPAAFIGAFFTGSLLIETLFLSMAWACSAMKVLSAATTRWCWARCTCSP